MKMDALQCAVSIGIGRLTALLTLHRRSHQMWQFLGVGYATVTDAENFCELRNDLNKKNYSLYRQNRSERIGWRDLIWDQPSASVTVSGHGGRVFVSSAPAAIVRSRNDKQDWCSQSSVRSQVSSG